MKGFFKSNYNFFKAVLHVDSVLQAMSVIWIIVLGRHSQRDKDTSSNIEVKSPQTIINRWPHSLNIKRNPVRTFSTFEKNPKFSIYLLVGLNSRQAFTQSYSKAWVISLYHGCCFECFSPSTIQYLINCPLKINWKSWCETFPDQEDYIIDPCLTSYQVPLTKLRPYICIVKCLELIAE